MSTWSTILSLIQKISDGPFSQALPLPAPAPALVIAAVVMAVLTLVLLERGGEHAVALVGWRLVDDIRVDAGLRDQGEAEGGA